MVIKGGGLPVVSPELGLAGTPAALIPAQTIYAPEEVFEQALSTPERRPGVVPFIFPAALLGIPLLFAFDDGGGGAPSPPDEPTPPEPPVGVIPEPASIVLLGTGLGLVAARARRRRE